MIHRTHYPFIYFLAEPTIVFVYQIKSNHYLSLTEFLSNSPLETYELKPGCAFSSFDHTVCRSIEDASYFIQQDDLNDMLEIVNSSIQQHVKRTVEEGPFHLVMSESVAGSLRFGLPRPKTVIGFPDFFSIGPLWQLEEVNGQAFRHEWLAERINFEMDDHVVETKFKNAVRELEDIPECSPIYIWCADNADEQVGLRYTLHLLRDKTNDIRVVNVSAEPGSNCHTGQLSPEELHSLFTQQEGKPPLTAQERLYIQQEWEKLSLTTDCLRIWATGELIGVPEDYYDAEILNCMDQLHAEQKNRDFIQVGEVIGELVTESTRLLNVFYLEYRIRQLVYSGLLELKGIPKSMRHYRVKLRK